MKQFALIFTLLLSASFSLLAQQALKPDYISKVPAGFKNCGALYTCDSVLLQKKKYILLTDFQNLGLISLGGKIIQLQLTDSKTVGKTNISIYNGSGYTIQLSYRTTSHTSKTDLETGTLLVSKGGQKLEIKIHGRSSCDPSTQESNGQ